MSNGHERPFDDLRSTLGAYARVLQSRGRLAFVAASLVSSIAFWFSQYLPRHYRASTIFERRDDVVLRNLIQSNSPYSFDHLKATLVMDMTGSRALAEATVNVGLIPRDVIPPEGALSRDALRALEAALDRHHLAASVKMMHTSPSLDTIRLECEASDREVARRFAVALRDRYLAQTRGRITEILLSTRQFFESEIERVQQQIAATNRGLRERFADFPGVDPTDLVGAGARLELLRQERARLREHKAELEAQISAREQFLASTASVADPDASATGVSIPPVLPDSEAAISRAMADIQQQIADATTLRRMTLEHPTVVNLQRKLDALYLVWESLRSQATTGGPVEATPARATLRPSAARLRIELELDALRRQLAIACANHEQADQKAERFARLYDELVRRGEELRATRDKLDQDAATIAMWRQNLGQLSRILAAESEDRGTRFVLLEDAKDSGRPVAPRVASVFAVCGGSGLVVAALLAVLAELLDRSFRSAGQVTRILGVPVLECVGVIPTPQVRRRRRIARWVWAPVLAGLIGVLLTTGTLAYARLQQPELHRRVVHKLDGVMPRFGTPDRPTPPDAAARPDRPGTG